jgi:ABC-type transport system involved in cytochrome bd biosynthesis fused ATPase/permease subunit
VAEGGTDRTREGQLAHARELLQQARREAAEAGSSPRRSAASFSKISPLNHSPDPPMNIAPALEIRALEKRYPRFTLGPLDLTIPTGAIYGLIGPNGAGKTTLIDQIFGMGAPDCGAIKVLGWITRSTMWQ